MKCFTDEDRLIDRAGSLLFILAFLRPEEPPSAVSGWSFPLRWRRVILCQGKRREKIASALAVRAISSARLAQGIIEELKVPEGVLAEDLFIINQGFFQLLLCCRFLFARYTAIGRHPNQSFNLRPANALVKYIRGAR